MFRTLLGGIALLALTACNNYNKTGVFIAYVPTANDPVCDTKITENIIDSEVPEETGTFVGDLVITETATRSDAIVLVMIYEAKDKDGDGAVLIDWGGTIFPGTRDGDTITATWTNSNQSSETRVNDETGYSYSDDDTSSTVNNITLTRNKETGGWTVAWSYTTTIDRTVKEVDEWDPYGTPYSGAINTTIFTYLTGTGSNSPTAVDCEAGNCQIKITSTCNGSLPGFEIYETSLEVEDAKAVEGHGQPSGFGSN